ncbi:MAG TPA: transcriptional regulator [Planctomycetaceae bacterium]|nr:transcriptional regulator [Planctomycetaceae bacterium]
MQSDRSYWPLQKDPEIRDAEYWVAKRLKQLRLAAGMTQKELASRMCITKSRISHLESGRKQPQLATLCRASKALGLRNLAEFFEGVPLLGCSVRGQ